MLKTYYQLTKPGIIYGNAMTAIAGFFLAFHGNFDWQLFLGMLFGICFVIGSACVFNNIYDSEMDSKMERTKNRAMVTHAISKKSAIIFGTLLGIIGVLLLTLFTNHYSLLTALIGFFVYVFLYTPLKHKTVYATLIGAVSGAVPITAGYFAARGHFDIGATLVFLILFFWQMPHFYAIAVYRLSDYAAASIPVLPVKQGTKTTKIHILIYIIAFIISCALLTYYKISGYTFLATSLILGILWLLLALKGFGSPEAEAKWGKKVFLFSLIILTVLSAVLGLNSVLP